MAAKKAGLNEHKNRERETSKDSR